MSENNKKNPQMELMQRCISAITNGHAEELARALDLIESGGSGGKPSFLSGILSDMPGVAVVACCVTMNDESHKPAPVPAPVNFDAQASQAIDNLIAASRKDGRAHIVIIPTKYGSAAMISGPNHMVMHTLVPEGMHAVPVRKDGKYLICDPIANDNTDGILVWHKGEAPQFGFRFGEGKEGHVSLRIPIDAHELMTNSDKYADGVVFNPAGIADILSYLCVMKDVMTFEAPMIGYKITNPDLQCKGVTYEPGVYTEYTDGPLVLHKSGFHVAVNPDRLHGWYDFDKNNRVFLCQMGPEVITDDSGKIAVTNAIVLLDELTWDEVQIAVEANKPCEYRTCIIETVYGDVIVVTCNKPSGYKRLMELIADNGMCAQPFTWDENCNMVWNNDLSAEDCIESADGLMVWSKRDGEAITSYQHTPDSPVHQLAILIPTIKSDEECDDDEDDCDVFTNENGLLQHLIAEIDPYVDFSAPVIGFKVTGANATCRGTIYTPGEWHEHDGDIAIGESGIHYADNIAPLFSWNKHLNASTPGSEVWLVQAGPNRETNGKGRCVTDAIVLLEKLSPAEIVDFGDDDID